MVRTIRGSLRSLNFVCGWKPVIVYQEICDMLHLAQYVICRTTSFFNMENIQRNEVRARRMPAGSRHAVVNGVATIYSATKRLPHDRAGKDSSIIRTERYCVKGYRRRFTVVTPVLAGDGRCTMSSMC